jgi:transcriptional regulator GlxA family with amidase domain
VCSSDLVQRDPAVAAVADALSVDPTLRVAALADRVGYSERQLRRRVHAEVGYGPKLLARVLRLQRVLRLARADASLSLADLAFAGGFVDQAHLSHESADLGGTTAAVLFDR